MTKGYRHIALDTVGSTNDEAMARLRAGDPAPFIVTARSQTGGRGRRGRAWTSPPGNLYMSLALLRPRTGGLGAAARLRRRRGAWRRCSAPSPRRRSSGLQLKWPNDVLLRWRQARRHAARKQRVLPGRRTRLRDWHRRELPLASLTVLPTLLPSFWTPPERVGRRRPTTILADFTRRFDIHLREWDRRRGVSRRCAPTLARDGGWARRAHRACRLHVAVSTASSATSTRPGACCSTPQTAGTIAVEAGDVFFPALAAATTD